MTGKLEGFQSISTNTTTNKYCQKQNSKNDPNNICTLCYSWTMLKTFRQNMAPSLQRNSDLLTSKILHPDALPVINQAFFRFNAHGELDLDKKKATINLINYINIAIKNPHCNFTLWTKRFDIIKPYFDKTFNNVYENIEVKKQNCTGQKCKDCLLCYKLNTTNTIIEKVKNYGKK